MGYTEHFRIRCPRNKDKRVSTGQDNCHCEDTKNLLSTSVFKQIPRQPRFSPAKKNPLHHPQNNK